VTAQPLTISFLLFPNVTQLDPAGPAQGLSQMPGVIELVADARSCTN
jgi:hypothetical protein